MKLTIGMACYDDFQGVWMTLQSLRLYHRDVLHKCELIVIDNHPQSDHGQAVRNLVEGWVRGDFLRVRYIPFTEYNSTSKPRQLIFENAAAPNVLVMDSHVMLPRNPGEESCLKRLIDWYEKNPDSWNILHGVMLYDDLSGFSTHFQDVFREEMWGIWGSDPKGANPNNPPFEIPAHGLGMFSARKEAWMQVGGFHPLHRGFGGEEWYIHTKFRKYGERNGLDCRTLCLPFFRWLHRFGHAGGIKYPLTILDKVRNYILEYQELQLPLERVALHFLARKNEDNTPRVGPPVTSEQWNTIVRNPEQYPIAWQPKTEQKSACQVAREQQLKPEPPNASPQLAPGNQVLISKIPLQAEIFPTDTSLADLLEQVEKREDGFCNLRESVSKYLAESKSVLCLMADHYEPALLALKYCTDLESIDIQINQTIGQAILPFSKKIQEVLVAEYDAGNLNGSLIDEELEDHSRVDFWKEFADKIGNASELDEFDGWDIALVQGCYRAETLVPLLTSLTGVAKRIVILNSRTHQEAIIDGPPDEGQSQPKMSPGVLPSIRTVLTAKKNWSVVAASTIGVGCVVLSSIKKDRKPLPSLITMGINFTKAMAEFVATGAEFADPEEYKLRLAICATCEFRNEDRCSLCGCFLSKKAQLAQDGCPIGRWKDEQDRSEAKEATLIH